MTSLKQGGRSTGEGKDRHRTRNLLMAGQVALALVLLVGSGLMVRSFQALRDVSPGFTAPEQVQTFRLRVPPAEMTTAETSVAYQRILENLVAIPGVTAVGASSSLTMDGWSSADEVTMEDFPSPPETLSPIRRLKWVSAGYHDVMGIPTAAGRSIEWQDIADGRRVAVITEDLAAEYWDQPADALGRRIGLGAPNSTDLNWYDIVGVTSRVYDDGLDQPTVPVVYFPYAGPAYRNRSGNLTIRRAMGFAVRTGGVNPGSVMPQVRQAVWAVNPTLPLATIRTLQDILDDSLARTSFTLTLLGIAAVVALLLGTVGIYGVVSYVVSQRTREIGVRMALGAERKHVSRMVVRQGMLVVGSGVIVGLIVAFGMTGLMTSLLFGVEATDPATYGAVAGTLTLVALVATYLPAARAARVDPVEALRWE